MVTELTKKKRKRYRDSHRIKARGVISDFDFWRILTEQRGLQAKTAAAIRDFVGKPYTRQAVNDRIQKNPDRFDEIVEMNIDAAESVWFEITRDAKARDVDRISAASKLIDSVRGRKRGYGKHVHVVTEEARPFEGLTLEDLKELVDE